MALGPQGLVLESGEAFLGSFVASGMGPSASSHGSPVPLPSDLSFRSPTPSNLPMVQLWAAHAHEGFSHLPSGLYPSYLHLNHLEPPSSGSPLLSQLGQPSIFDTQKDGFFLPAPGAPGALHSHVPSSSRTPGGHSSGASTKGSSRDVPAKERAGRGGEPPPLFGKKDPRAREEAVGPRGVVDLTQEARAEGRQDRGPPRLPERLSPFLAEPGPPRVPGTATTEPKSKNPPPPSVLSLCNGSGDPGLSALVAEAARGAKEAARQDESARRGAQRPCFLGLAPAPHRSRRRLRRQRKEAKGDRSNKR
ncbi:Trinucleotide repeat-containing gene 18 protein [Camelus dromedarius]|uniref:Trinucleotide repeat-containing gene 18 protein n=1 Tax=Camelus dromedarius TaxID=9838 RepID=A0A5N4CXM5_CAMDR|nr:Trinucleotide repeat-containing gene 18 protein [Camelus dromedarius]